MNEVGKCVQQNIKWDAKLRVASIREEPRLCLTLGRLRCILVANSRLAHDAECPLG